MLLNYPEKQYNKALSVNHCEAFICQCTKRIAKGNNLEACQEAVWELLEQTQTPVIPQATIGMFTLAAQSVLTALHTKDEASQYHALVLLQPSL